jgi:hypothetical protein
MVVQASARDQEKKKDNLQEICKIWTESVKVGTESSRLGKIKSTFSPNLTDFLQISYRLPAGKGKLDIQENKNSGCPKFLNLENKFN